MKLCKICKKIIDLALDNIPVIKADGHFFCSIECRALYKTIDERLTMVEVDVTTLKDAP